MLLIRDERPRDVGQVRMIDIAAFEQPDEAFVARILKPAALAIAAGFGWYRPEFDAVARCPDSQARRRPSF